MWDEALRLLRDILELDPDHPLTNYNMGFVLYFGKKLPGVARERFTAALRADPRMAAAQYAMGHLLLHVNKDHQGARQHLQQAVALNPHLAEAHNTLGFAAIARVDWNEAVQRFREAVSVSATYDAAWCNLSVACINRGYIAEAIEAGKQYARLQPSSAVAHSNLGNLFGMSGMTTEAIAEFTRAIELDPDNWLLYFWSGCLRLKIREYGKAVVLFNEAMRLHGKMALIHYNLALAHEALGRSDIARENICAAIELDPALGKNLIMKGEAHGTAGMPEAIGAVRRS
jgi:tetratricopeptide (TPR) repeat protein